MNLLAFLFVPLFSLSVPSMSGIDGIDSVVISCGFNPNGDWECVRTEFDDGSDCLVIVTENESGDSITFHGCS